MNRELLSIIKRKRVIKMDEKFEENTAGSLMTNQYINLSCNLTVEKALKKIRKNAHNKKTINVSYVLDKTKKLIGEVYIKDILLANDNCFIKTIMRKITVSVQTNTPDFQVSDLFKKYDVHAMPVVDENNKMVGIITIDDILDVIEDSATEDFEKMAALLPSEESYLKTSVLKHTKNRIIWLTFLMISSIFTGMILTSFENILSQELVLIAFLPLLMSTAGNCGSQVATLMIRGIALGEIFFKDYIKIFLKETQIALLLGVGLSIFNFIRIWLQYGRIELAIIISITLMTVIILANIIGFSMPILAKKIHLDPAVMSLPIITTLLDFLVILIYFLISSAILSL